MTVVGVRSIMPRHVKHAGKRVEWVLQHHEHDLRRAVTRGFLEPTKNLREALFDTCDVISVRSRMTTGPWEGMTLARVVLFDDRAVSDYLESRDLFASRTLIGMIRSARNRDMEWSPMINEEPLIEVAKLNVFPAIKHLSSADYRLPLSLIETVRRCPFKLNLDTKMPIGPRVGQSVAPMTKSKAAMLRAYEKAGRVRFSEALGQRINRFID